jgi:hypothetical protein
MKSARRVQSRAARLLWAGALLFLVHDGKAAAGESAAERACTALAERPDDAKSWLDIAGQLAAGARLSCRGELQKKFLGSEYPNEPYSPANPRLIGGAARRALAMTWSSSVRSKAFRLLTDTNAPRLVACSPTQQAEHVDCPVLEGDPAVWWGYRSLFIAESGKTPESPDAFARADAAAARSSGWATPGTASSLPCTPSSDSQPAFEGPPSETSGHCGKHGYRLCPVKPDSTWVHVAYTPCEGDKLQKTELADQNGDGIDEAFLWIKYDTFDGADVSGSRTHLYVVDGRSGSILLHGLVAATSSEAPDKGQVRIAVKRTSPGRLTLTASVKPTPSVEMVIRTRNPWLLAPGTYVLGDAGFHRSDGARAAR